MKHAVAACAVLAALGCVPGCGNEKPRVERAELQGGVVARVDGEGIRAETVGDIARTQGVSVERALELATFDALLAREAKDRGLDKQKTRELHNRLVAALIDDLAAEARAAGPPTDEELARAAAPVWYDLARPASAVVVHAVVMVPEHSDTATEARALELAKKIRAAVEPVQELARKQPAPTFYVSPQAPFVGDPLQNKFIALAAGVEKGDLEVVAQTMQPVGVDGFDLSLEKRNYIDPRFVAGAMALKERGDLSQPVRSDYGYHVILLFAKLPEKKASRDELIARFESAIMTERTRAAIAATLANAKKATVANVDRTADELLSQVKVDR